MKPIKGYIIVPKSSKPSLNAMLDAIAHGEFYLKNPVLEGIYVAKTEKVVKVTISVEGKK